VGRLILGCRNAGVGNQAAQEISDATGSNAVTCWPLDLSSFASVSAFVTRIQDEGVTVDILVGNAAIMDTLYTQTEDGWEKKYANMTTPFNKVTENSRIVCK
jgi:NAD(P)-dependent dehydrogenase (short-subunit alcohol dehydrogenase family)